jgi:hypothetical protein
MTDQVFIARIAPELYQRWVESPRHKQWLLSLLSRLRLATPVSQPIGSESVGKLLQDVAHSTQDAELALTSLAAIKKRYEDDLRNNRLRRLSDTPYDGLAPTRPKRSALELLLGFCLFPMAVLRPKRPEYF